MFRRFTKSRMDLALLGAIAIAISSVILFRSLWASSPDEWDAFRTELSDACAVASEMTDPAVTVDPFGTSRYGVALVTGMRADETGAVTLVCVATKSPDGPVDVEISAPTGAFVAAAD